MSRFLHRTVCRSVAAIVAIACSASVAAALAPGMAAEVLDIQGTGEQRPNAQTGWQPAKASQGLPGGAFVRTAAASRMALVFADETQIRINQNTLLEIKDVAREGQGFTALRLERGRAWARARRVADGLQLETPAATAAIRGTDWELEVGPDGRTTLVVLTGTVEFFNAQGRVSVDRGEAATADVGKAPVKILLTRPRDRIQWVNALRFEPRRYAEAAKGSPALAAALAAIDAGDAARARDMLQTARRARQPDAAIYDALAELELVLGDIDEAIAVARDGLALAPRDPDLLARLARAQLVGDRVDDAKRTVALPRDADTASILVAAGEVARRQGLAPQAFESFGRATRVDAADDRAWYALGAAQNEREDITPARRNLATAIGLNPDGAGYQGELGTLETFANRFAEAEKAFAAALAANPADYVALTGLGLLRLKQGHAAAALDCFLRAEVMEPRYARAKTYSAVAYYQLGRRDEAIAAMRHAAELDDKDPLPYLYLSQMYTDLFRPGDAVAASRDAVARLPYLKSLNQVANNQQGTANLGYSLAFFGLEDWALELAQQSYDPYSGGSHLFLADRYKGEFNKNSELFQGFLADPTAFGGSNRYSTLVPTAGRYATAGASYDQGDLRLANPYLRLNGLVDWPMRSAYFVDVESGVGTVQAPGTDAQGNPQTTVGDARAELYTLGLGTLVTEELGLFAYGTKFRYEQVQRELDRASGDFDKARIDVGARWRFSPTATTWVKFGRTNDHQLYDNFTIVSTDPAGMLTARSRFDAAPRDLAVRHTMDLTPADHLSFGAEFADDRRNGRFIAGGTTETTSGTVAFVALSDQDATLRSKQAYVSYGREIATGVQVQADLFWQQFYQHVIENDAIVARSGDTDIPLLADVIDSAATDTEWNPRIGIVWKPRGATVRAAWQRWRQPASVSTLAPVATAGIPLDDQLVSTGGKADRGVVLVNVETDPRTNVGAYFDYEDVKNLGRVGFRIPTPNIQFVDLLRNAQLLNVASLEILEGTPDFDEGRAASAGVFVNRILAPQLSIAAKYVYTHNTADLYVRDEAGNAVSSGENVRIPYVPTHFASLGVTWVSPLRVYLSAQTIYRSERYTDRENTPEGRVPADWNTRIAAFWETPDKRLIIAAGALNLGSKATKESYVVDVRYRF